MGVSMEDVRTAIANSNAVGPLGTFDGVKRARHHRHQRPTARRQRIRPAGGEDRQRHRDPPVHHRLDHAERAQQPARPAGSTSDPSVLLIITKQANANVIDTVDRIYRAAARTAAMGAGRPRYLGAGRPHPDHPRQRARHAAHARRHRHPGDAGGGAVPAPHRADARRRRHRAAVARRHLRGDVGGRILHRQSVADGARGLHRLRGGRRHRDDREHVPLSGTAAPRRCAPRSRAPSRSASPWCRSRYR